MSSFDGQPPASLPSWNGGAPAHAGVPAHVPDNYPNRAMPPALNGLDVGRLLRGLRRHWVLAMTLSLICSGSAAALAWKLLPAAKYTARALVRVSASAPSVLRDPFENTNEFKTFQMTQQTLIKSRKVLNTVVTKEEIKDLPTILAQLDPVSWIEDNLTVKFQGEIMVVSLSGDRPSDLKELVNKVVESYLENLVNVELYERKAKHEDIKKSVEKYEAQLTDLRMKQRKLSTEGGASDRDSLKFKHELALSQAANVRRELAEASNEHQKAEIQFKIDQSKETFAHAAGLSNAAIQRLVERDPKALQMQAKIQEIENAVTKTERVVRKGSHDPALSNGRRALADARATYQEFVEDLVREAQMSGTGGQKKMAEIADRIRFWGSYKEFLTEELARWENEAKAINITATDMTSTMDQIENLKTLTQTISNRANRLEVDLDAPSRIELIEKAEEPRVADAKKRIVLTGGVGLATMGLILLGISFLEYRIRRIDSADAVAQGLGLRLVGALPATPTRSRFALPGRQGAALQEAYWRSRLNESVNAIRTLMLRHSQTERLQVVMVTSASVGEGKTSLACHLATSLARAGRKTLLLDCDLRNPTAHRVFDLPLEPGMSEALRGQVPLDEISHPIALGELRMITAGRCNLDALHALGMEQIREIIERLRQQYEFIVVDTPPVLPVADPLLIGQHVDAALFSILRDVSQSHKVHTACERLSSLGIRILGAVVAGTPLETSGSEYYYTAAYVGAGKGSQADGEIA